MMLAAEWMRKVSSLKFKIGKIKIDRVFARRKFPGSLFRNASEIWESGRRFAGKAVPKWKSPEIYGVFRRNFRCANTLIYGGWARQRDTFCALCSRLPVYIRTCVQRRAQQCRTFALRHLSVSRLVNFTSSGAWLMQANWYRAFQLLESSKVRDRS